MEIVHQHIHYTSDDAIFQMEKVLPNGIQIKSYIVFVTEEFRDYQKDILQESLANLVDDMWQDHYQLDKIKDAFEETLNTLNTKLKWLAEKMEKVDYFYLKWFVQVVADNVLMTSMIGDVSLMIWRRQKLYYSLHNTTVSESKIDVFSDFIEWDVQRQDQILYVGTKISDVLDDVDIQWLDTAIWQDQEQLLAIVDDLLRSRIDIQNIWFMTHHDIQWYAARNIKWAKSKFSLPGLKWQLTWLEKYKKLFVSNKYYVSIAILSVVILFLLYHVLAQIVSVRDTDVMFTEDGLLVDVTIEDIKQDIQIFLSMDPTSDAKGQKYHEAMQKLDVLEQRGRWLDDVEQLRSIIQTNYLEWFNIIYINNMSAFNDAWWSAQILAFNNAERNALGDLVHIEAFNTLAIAGSQWAMLGAINSSVRGSLIDFSSPVPISGCSKNLLRNGLYCHTTDTIYNVTNAGIEVLTTTDQWFPDDIDAVDVYGQANMYVFHKDFASPGTGSRFVTRYRNMMGSQTQYQWGQSSSVLTDLVDNTFDMWFSAYAIDGSFMAWSQNNNRLYQFWREGASTLLSVRAVPLQWWDKATVSYSSDVVPHASLTSRYVYLLDRENQTFTVYDSSPAKDGDAFGRSFNLRYLFRFNFDLWDERIIDFSIPEWAGNRPELYLLTNTAVYKIRLHEFITSLADGALKRVGG